VNARVLRDFNDRFNGKDAAWYESTGGFIVKFVQDSMKTAVAYAKRGRWLYTIRHYQENKLPKDIRHAIMSEYYDDNIIQVDDVVTPRNKQPVYIIHMVSTEKQHRIVRYSDNGMEVVKTYAER
jgi:hypothetical protein